MDTAETKIQTPVIVTFANQKGGVGKTTLCAAFANYLVTMGVRVMVIDCDFQRSIVKRREVDIRKYGERHLPYEVIGVDANDKDGMETLMEKLRNEPGIDIVLMDSPGSLKAKGLSVMFANSDYIIIPFHYDVTTVPSTATFLMFLSRLREAVRKMNARLVLVPNMNDGRVGKKTELLMWEKTQETFSRYGMVTDKIPKRADMERISTMADLDMQASIVRPVFKAIYADIFGTDLPYRPVGLTGIQLMKNRKAANKETDEEPSEAEHDETPDNSEEDTAHSTNPNITEQ